MPLQAIFAHGTSAECARDSAYAAQVLGLVNYNACQLALVSGHHTPSFSTEEVCDIQAAQGTGTRIEMAALAHSISRARSIRGKDVHVSSDTETCFKYQQKFTLPTGIRKRK